MRKIILFFLAMVVVLCTLPLQAQNLPPDVLDEVQQEIIASTDFNALGAAYAAISNFAVVPDISSATYSIDDGSSVAPEIRLYKIPIKFYLDKRSNGNLPFIQVNAAYQEMDAFLELGVGEGADTQWTTAGATVTSGMEIPLGDSLTLVPAVDLGILQLENDTTYVGPISTTLLQPVLDNLLFNWQSDAWVAGAALGLDYDNELANKDLRIHSTLNHNHIKSYSSSSPQADFSHGVTTFNFDSEWVIPTGKSIAGYPLAIAPYAGFTAFVGQDRESLGFNRFFKLGVIAEIDIGSLGKSLQKLRLGFKLVEGSDLEGLIFEFGYRY